MTVRLVRIDDLPVGRWPNGHGETRSVLADEGLQVGIARIHEAAPFSVLAGRDRLLTVLGPQGILLLIDGEERRLAPGDGIRFRGDAAVSVAATAAPTAVLNLIHDSGWSVEAFCAPAGRATEPIALVAAGRPAAERTLALGSGELAVRLDRPADIDDRLVLASWRRARADVHRTGSPHP